MISTRTCGLPTTSGAANCSCGTNGSLSDATISAGERPTFKLRVKGSGQVYVHVCKTKRKDAKGLDLMMRINPRRATDFIAKKMASLIAG